MPNACTVEVSNKKKTRQNNTVCCIYPQFCVWALPAIDPHNSLDTTHSAFPVSTEEYAHPAHKTHGYPDAEAIKTSETVVAGNRNKHNYRSPPLCCDGVSCCCPPECSMPDADLCPDGESCIEGESPDFGYTCGERMKSTCESVLGFLVGCISRKSFVPNRLE